MTVPSIVPFSGSGQAIKKPTNPLPMTLAGVQRTASDVLGSFFSRAPIIDNAHLVDAYEKEVARRPLKPVEVAVLGQASKNWLPPIVTTLASAPEQLIVRPDRAASTFAHVFTATSTAIASALGGIFKPALNFSHHAVSSAFHFVASGITSGLVGLWNATLGHIPIMHIASHASSITAAGATVKAAAATSAISLGGMGAGATIGLGFGALASLVLTPLVALAQHFRNRNVMATMSSIFNMDTDNKRTVSPNMLDMRKEGPFNEAHKETRNSKAHNIFKAFAGGRSLIDL
ncbi:MAG: hypothetical protein VKK59_06630 [Vampirovibrionales bacterium]|nr:hypothetical protein [Vampirovibrionales bacterium]